MRDLSLHPFVVDLGQILLKTYLQLLGVFLDRPHEGFGFFGLEVPQDVAFCLVYADFVVDVLLVLDDLGGGESDDVGVFFPCFEDAHEISYLLLEVDQL